MYLFANIGYAENCTAPDTLKNIDLLNVTGITNMPSMFRYCGYNTMTSLDLGPLFTKIPGQKITKQESDYEDWESNKILEYNAYEQMLYNTGKSGVCTIYVSEAIYKNEHALKLNSTDTTATPTGLQHTRGTIIEKYKTE